MAALVLLVLAPSLAYANGGTLRLANVVMGQYRVSVFTDPTPVRPDSLDVSVLVLQEGLDGVVEGLLVEIVAEPVEDHGGVTTTRRATREMADDPRYYAAKFPLGSEGGWRITVAVEGPDGSGSAGFEVTAREPGLLGHPLFLSALALLPLLLAGAWILRGADDEEA